MAEPVYSNDLITIATADEDDTNWDEFTGNNYDGQGTEADLDPEYPYIQGLYAITQQCTKDATIGSLGYDYGSGITLPTDGAVFIWQNYSNTLQFGTYEQGGFRLVIGSSYANFDAWYTGGQDKAPYPYGGWDCQVVNPGITPDDQAGGGNGGTYQCFGGAVYVITGVSKGNPHQVDAIRYGRGSAIFEQGQMNNPATIAGFAALNGLQDNRWGLIQETQGGYLWQGRMLFGTDTTGTVFIDTNVNVFIKWTPKVTENFNLIEVKNPETYVSMTGFTIQVLDNTTASRGRFRMTDAADVYLDRCTFVDMDTFIFDTTTGFNTVEITDCVFRRCNQVTQGGATINGCSFDNSDATSSILVDNLDEISDCAFISDGDNHAFELNSNHAGNTYTLTNCTYDGYETANGDTGNEPLYNNSGGHVTINVSGGNYPFYRNGPGASTTIVQSINWYFKIVDANGDIVNTAELRIYDDDDNQLFGVETSDGTELYSFDGSLAGTNARIVVHDLNYLHNSQTLVHPSTSNSEDAPTVIVLAVDRVYDNPT
ncbi:MAG: hypothetical protein PVG65_00895 [Candidatus Thorarchaeota archaeon]|jgi:hypothetical protein